MKTKLTCFVSGALSLFFAFSEMAGEMREPGGYHAFNVFGNSLDLGPWSFVMGLIFLATLFTLIRLRPFIQWLGSIIISCLYFILISQILSYGMTGESRIGTVILPIFGIIYGIIVATIVAMYRTLVKKEIL